ncbi:MAG: hypothetical protein H7096_06725 [Flavobacterium sp.]|nr:hypothetical protein [Pedobacter sp.]
MKPFLFILIFSVAGFSCKKDEVQAGAKMEFYLLKSSQMLTNKCQVDASKAVLEDIPIISNQDILEYNRRMHEFTFSANSVQKLMTLRDGFPFAVTIDNRVIYYGINKPSYSSSTCDHSITMDYASDNNKVTMKLGYPGEGFAIDDQRNNPEILATLGKQRKLR